MSEGEQRRVRLGLREQVDFLALRTMRWLDDDVVQPPPLKALPPAGTDGLAPGVIVSGRYQLEKVLGQGGFGRVWKALDEKSGRGVALKEMLRSTEAFDESAQATLEQEFFTLSKLRHPNIVAVQDYGELTDGTRFIVMELVPGHDVVERLKGGPLPRNEAATILADMVQALQLLHSRLYVHCDVKAENVRVGEKGRAKLMDFGLLHQLGTPATQVQGTPQYMAPEMFTAGVIDQRTDLYSLGVLAYEMFTGSLPFQGQSMGELVQQHLREEPKAPSWFLDLPPAIDAIVLRLLAKDPDKRFQNAGELLDALTPFVDGGVERAPAAHRTAYLYSAALIGRDEERALLADVKTGLTERRGASLFVVGSGGQGKTRLLEEFKIGVKLNRVPWAGGQCRATGLAPLVPIVEALTTLVARTPKALFEARGPSLAGTIPAVRALGFEPAHVHDDAQAKANLYEGIVGWLRDLSAVEPFVLCIEDLHWSDGATIDLYNHLARSLVDAPIAFVGTFRSNEVPKTSMLYATVHERRTRLVDLRPLSRAAVGALLQDCLRQVELPADFVERLAETTGGNPFFVIETLRALVEGGQLVQKADRWSLAQDDLALPASIDEVVQRRLAHAPAALVDVCRALAPIGRAIDQELAAAVTKLPKEGLFDVLDQLVERQFLVRERATFGFAHETVRAGVYASTPEPRRRATHGEIAGFLEQKKGASGEIAHHYKRSTDPDRAVPHFLAGARGAVAAQQPLEATKLLNQGVEILEASTRKDRRDLLVTSYDMLGMLSFRSHPPSCVNAVDALTKLWCAELDPDAVVAKIRARIAFAAKLPKAVQRFLPKPPPPGPDFDPTTRDPGAILGRMLMLHAQEAMALASLGQVERSLSLIDQIQTRLPTPQSPVRVMCSVPKLLAFIHMGRYRETLETAKQTIGALDKFPGPMPPPLKFAYFFNHYGHGIGEALGGTRLDEAVSGKCVAIAQAIGNVTEKAFSLLPRFVQACFQGDPKAFSQYAAEMEEVCQRLGWPQPLSSRLTLWTPVYHLDRGEYAQAGAVVDRIAQFAEMTRDGWLETYAMLFRGMLALHEGDLPRADELLAKAVPQAEERKLGRLTTAWCVRAELFAKMGRAEDARALAERAVVRATSADLGCPYDVMTSFRVRGQLVGGNAGEADLDWSISAAAAQGNLVQEALSQLALGSLRQRDRQDGGASLQAASQLFERTSNTHGLARAGAGTPTTEKLWAVGAV